MDMAKPKIRFKGYQEDWEQRKLGELVERITRKNQDLVSELPLTISAQYGLIDQNEFFDKRVASKDVSGYYLIKNGEFAYNKSTSTEAPWGAIKRLDCYENGVLSTLYIIFGIKEDVPVDSDFLASYYSTNLWHKGIHEIAAEGARNHGLLNIAPADFFETKLMIPQDVEEQKKIGKYFTMLEALITLHQRKCDQTKKLKKFMLQKMFPQNGKKVPELRFSEFTDDWEQRKLGEFGKTTGGTSIESEFNELGKYKVISIGSYSETSKYNDQGIRANKTNKTESRILNKNNLTMILNDKTASGNIIGRVLLIDADDSYVFNQRTERIEVYENEYLPEFLYHFLNADNIREKIIRAAQGNTQIYVNWNSISELSYKIPLSKHEQRKIADLFNQLDNLITLHQRKYEELQKVKKFMLQNMFV